MDGNIIVVAHKAAWMPEDALYLPVQVGGGAPLGPPFVRDDTGATIAEKNPHYCELTALYWAWQNLPGDFLGLAHYRRHFTAGQGLSGRLGLGDKRARVLTGAQLRALWDGRTVLLPKPRRYRIETNRSQYAHAHHGGDLDACRDAVGARYEAAFDAVMARTWGHRFNMFVMPRPVLDRYCAWLFGALGTLEGRLDIGGYSAYDQRVFGFLGERLLDVWMEAEGVGYRELPVMFMERENWVRKGGRFLVRKVRGGR